MIKDITRLPNSQMNLCNCGEPKRTYAKQCRKCFESKRYLDNKTKEQMVGDNWWTKRIPIAKHARKIYIKSDRLKVCVVCGYDKHYEVCHIRGVADFSNESTIEEINSLDNLIALCRNCHWEYDKGLIKL